MASQIPARWSAEEVEVLTFIHGIISNHEALRPSGWCGVAEGVTMEMESRHPNQEHRLYTPFSCRRKYDKLARGVDTEEEDEDDDTVAARLQTPYQHHHHNQARVPLGDIRPDDPRYVLRGVHPDLLEMHGDQPLGASPAGHGPGGAQSSDAGGEEGMMGGGMMAPPSAYGPAPPEGFATPPLNAEGQAVQGGGGSDGHGDVGLGLGLGEGERFGIAGAWDDITEEEMEWLRDEVARSLATPGDNLWGGSGDE